MTVGTVSIGEIVRDLETLYDVAAERRIWDIAKWAAELAICAASDADASLASCATVSFADEASTSAVMMHHQQPMSMHQKHLLRFVHALFENREFKRAAFHTRKQSHPLLQFMHFYATYLAGEKNKLDSNADLIEGSTPFSNEQISPLIEQMSGLISHDRSQADPWMLYLFGLLQKQAGMQEESLSVLVECVNRLPVFWGAWLLIADLIDSNDQLESLTPKLPAHWLKSLFLAEVHIRLHQEDEALLSLDERVPKALRASPYVQQRRAQACHFMTPQNDSAVIQIFEELQEQDPYRLEGIDLYSDSLYVRGMRPELASLAHHVFAVDKYSQEACCVTGNYFAIRKEHERAIEYFRRALRLNPSHAGAWVLIGHEYMELANHAAATIAYHSATQIDPKDYRAWYALGQSYEIAKLPSWALHYHIQAHRLCPRDSRFLVGLGEVYERLGHPEEASRAYWKAHSVGDVENGRALLNLGLLYEKLKEKADDAATIYGLYLQRLSELKENHPEREAIACRFLMNYHLGKHKLDEAHYYAQKCLEFDRTQEDAKGVLRKVAKLREDAKSSSSNSKQAEAALLNSDSD